MSTSFKSMRLNQAIRSDIQASMIEAWKNKNPIPHDIKAMENKIADDIWKKHYGKLPLAKLPQNMLNHSNSVQVQIAGSVNSFAMSYSRAYEYQSEYAKSIIEIQDEPSADIVAFRNAKQKVTEWENTLKSFTEEINVILESVTTTGSLIQLWPEAEQYLPPFAADPSKGVNLPALKTSRLNEMLGIK
jgi:hypothetical protein